jgi:hypothetical protein
MHSSRPTNLLRVGPRAHRARNIVFTPAIIVFADNPLRLLNGLLGSRRRKRRRGRACNVRGRSATIAAGNAPVADAKALVADAKALVADAKALVADAGSVSLTARPLLR